MDFNVVKSMVEEFFNGQYEVKKFLGEGSFAEVYLVKHKYLDDLRAIKIIKEPLCSASNTKHVFEEVRLATQLRHPNIIGIYDAGIISTFGLNDEGRFNLMPIEENNGDDWAYFIMEYVQGGDLQQYLTSFVDSNISMPITRVLDIIKQILLGLNTLHSAEPVIVHRDLKPNNILLSVDSKGEIVIKISDFGFAREVSTSTIDVEVAGNKNYMAPECFNKVFSTKTDIYAIGVIFYQILSNHCPYDVNKFGLLEVMEDKPWKNPLNAPSHYRSEIPSYIDEVVMKCLAINPKDRYVDAAELLVDVEKCIERFESETDDDFSQDLENDEDFYSEYIMNDSIRRAFELAKCENGLGEAIEILEREILADYDIRKCYSNTLRVWKSDRPDIKLISQAFTVNLRGTNYKLSINFLKEAIAYNPSIKSKYLPYVELWNIFSDLKKYGNMIKAVLSLEDLMNANKEIYNEYIEVLPILKTYSVEDILNEAVRLANLNSLGNAAKLMEFAVVADNRIRAKYSYKLSLLKQNMKMDLSIRQNGSNVNTIDYAIDLGTTDSVVAYYNHGNPVVVKNYLTGEDFTPSAVFIDSQDNIQIGENARDAIIENSNDAVSEFKNNMGFPIPFRFDKSSHVMLPEELSAEVLKDLRKSAYNQFGETLEHVVITVPANSNPMKTKAVNDAAELAGFRSHNLILEPIAVAIAYGLDAFLNEIWMVYDLGGATFNVSLIKNKDGEIQKIDTIGLENLGGNAFDRKIIDEIFTPVIIEDLNLDDFKEGNSIYSNAFSRLKKAAEKAKKELSYKDESRIFIENLLDGYDFRYTLKRNEFKETISNLVDYSLKLCNDLLDRNDLDCMDITKIILAGGSSLSPVVREFIQEEFEIPVDSSIDPLTVVARGAAIYAGSLEKPLFESDPDKLSLILKSDCSGIKGKVFAEDMKFPFLGYGIELLNEDYSTVRMPLDVDGTFKTGPLDDGEYVIHIFDDDGNLVEIDEKSPSSIIIGKDNLEIYIGFFKRNFRIPQDESISHDLIDRYDDFINHLNYLKEIYSIEDVDGEILDYLELLMSIKNSGCQASIYLDYLESKADKIQEDLDLAILIDNIQRKIDIVIENNYFEIDDILSELDEAIEEMNLNKLNDIYNRLIERYVAINREEVIESCFFNLRYEGIYTKNRLVANDLIKNGLKAINDSDYNRLFNIVNHLYEIDERNQ